MRPRPLVILWAILGSLPAYGQGAVQPSHTWTVRRLPDNPIISPKSDPSIGTNINGPSVIRVPEWVKNPLGRYYLYFADHNGKFIRLAHAGSIEGPWTVHRPGALQLSESHFTDHIASPEAVVDEGRHLIRLYYHGLTTGERAQHTRVAQSEDGIHFVATKEPVGQASAYWRVFRHGGWWHALSMPGKLFRSKDGLTPFEPGPQLFPASPTFVHNALLLEGDTLHVFYTRAGDKPERILASRVELGPDWAAWKPTPPEEVIAPETEWEGVNLPLTEGRIGAVEGPIRALRDPCIYEENGRIYLFYAVAGESGIGIAELTRR